MPFHRPLTPFERESGFHGIVIAFQSLSRVLEFGQPLYLDRMEPGIQPLTLLLPQHRRKVGDKFIRFLDLLIGFTQLRQVFLLVF